MAIRIQQILIDDLGSTDSVTTRHFGLEDVSYEIDLSPTNLQRLHKALDPFIAAGNTALDRPRHRRRAPDGPASSTNAGAPAG